MKKMMSLGIAALGIACLAIGCSSAQDDSTGSSSAAVSGGCAPNDLVCEFDNFVTEEKGIASIQGGEILVAGNSGADAVEATPVKTYPNGVLKRGNNGTVSCATFCAGEQWGGFAGKCIGESISDLPCGMGVGLIEPENTLNCYCRGKNGETFLKPGNNGSVTCDAFCGGEQWGRVGTCVNGAVLGSGSTPIKPTVDGAYTRRSFDDNCNLVPGLIPNSTHMACFCSQD